MSKEKKEKSDKGGKMKIKGKYNGVYKDSKTGQEYHSYSCPICGVENTYAREGCDDQGCPHRSYEMGMFSPDES